MSTAGSVPSLRNQRFELERKLGAGGFGVVYAALDRERAATVALKTLQGLDPAQLYRLKQEFRTLADLSHPNLVSLYELHADGNEWFFTMELVDGPGLLAYVRNDDGADATFAEGDRRSDDSARSEESPAIEAVRSHAPHARDADSTSDERSRSTPSLSALGRRSLVSEPPPAGEPAHEGFDEHRVRHVFGQLVDAVAALHDAGIVHRDIKPPNVLVTHAGRVVLLDFGLATEAAAHESIATVAGTPLYMAPEQIESGTATPASDWYAVGALLYEALTGAAPFSSGGSLSAGLMAKLDRDAEPPSRVRAGIPADLDAICAELLRKDPATRPSAAVIRERIGTASASPARVSGARARADVFVGRDAETGVLADAFTTLRDEARGGVVLVRGRSGMGKTSIARRAIEVMREKEPRTVALAGRCYEQESVPFKAIDGVVDALARWLRRRGTDAAQYVPRDVALLSRLFPVLEQVEPVRTSAVRAEPTDTVELRRRAGVALRELFARVGDRRPLVVLIDDLQWGDLDSASLLLDVIRPPDPPPMLLVVTYRDDDVERSACLAAFLSAIERVEGLAVHAIDVGPLDPAEARSLARKLLGGSDTIPAAITDGVANESGGRPVYIGALAQYLVEQNATEDTAALDDVVRKGAEAPSLDHVIVARIDRLPEDAQKLLDLVALAGRPIARDAVVRASGIGAGELVAVRRLRTDLLLRTVGSRGRDALEPYHDRIRHAVVSRIPKDVAEKHHRVLAEVLEASGETDAETLASHWLGAGEPARAFDHARRAADDARRALAFDRAARLYALAIELGGDRADADDLRLALADALMDAGRAREAADTWLAVVPHVAHERAQGLRRLAAQGLLAAGHVERGLAVLDEVLGAVSVRLPSGPYATMARLLLLRVWLWVRGLGFRARPQPTAIDDGERFLDATWAGATGLALVDTSRGWYLITRHLLAALRRGDELRVARALAVDFAYSAGFGGSSPSGIAKRAEPIFRAIADRANDGYTSALVLMNRGASECLRGNFRPSLELLDRASEALLHHPGTPWERNAASTFAIGSLHWMGRWRDCESRLRDLVEDARRRGDVFGETTLVAEVGHIGPLLRGDAISARREVESAMSAWTARDFFSNQHFFASFSIPTIGLYEGEPEVALAYLDAIMPALRRSLFLEVQWARGMHNDVRGRASLAAAMKGTDPSVRAKHLASVRRCIRKLAKEGVPWTLPLASILEAGLATLDDATRSRATMWLERAQKEADSAHLGHIAAFAAFRRAELAGEDPKADPVARAWLDRERVAKVEALADLIAPGRYARSAR